MRITTKRRVVLMAVLALVLAGASPAFAYTFATDAITTDVPNTTIQSTTIVASQTSDPNTTFTEIVIDGTILAGDSVRITFQDYNGSWLADQTFSSLPATWTPPPSNVAKTYYVLTTGANAGTRQTYWSSATNSAGNVSTWAPPGGGGTPPPDATNTDIVNAINNQTSTLNNSINNQTTTLNNAIDRTTAAVNTLTNYFTQPPIPPTAPPAPTFRTFMPPPSPNYARIMPSARTRRPINVTVATLVEPPAVPPPPSLPAVPDPILPPTDPVRPTGAAVTYSPSRATDPAPALGSLRAYDTMPALSNPRTTDAPRAADPPHTLDAPWIPDPSLPLTPRSYDGPLPYSAPAFDAPKPYDPPQPYGN